MLKTMVMSVVESPPDWGPAEAANDDGKGMKLVLLSEKNGTEVIVDEDVSVDVELCIVVRGDWQVDCEEEAGICEVLCVCDDG